MKEKAKHIAFIGTGPVTLIKSILISKKNPLVKITIIDRSSEIGGAWYSDLSENGSHIESGCHIWSYCPESYDFIKEELGVKLKKMRPAPVFVTQHIKLPYSLKNSVDSYKFLIKNLVLFRFKNLKQIKHKPNIQLKIFGKHNQYPLKGSPEFISALLNKVNSLENITFLKNTEIGKIQLTHDKVCLNRKFNESLYFDKVFLTSVTDLNKIEAKDFEINIKHRKTEYIHILLKLSKPLKKQLTYWRLMNDPIIHRIADISYQTEHSENLLLIGIKESEFYSNSIDQLVNHCINFFSNLSLTKKQTKIEFLRYHIYPTTYINNNQRIKINSIDKTKLELIHTTDLMHGIFHAIKNS